MAINIVDAIKEKLGTDALKKIDVNVPHQSETKSPASTDHTTQACVAAVLVALYRYGKSDDGATAIAAQAPVNWLSTIFLGKEMLVAQKVAGYSGESPETCIQLMNVVVHEAITQIHASTGNNADAIKTYMASQRHNILAYLPAELEMGKLLDDTTLDDRTNKMEGPVSSFLHWIENIMAPGEQATKEVH